MKLVKLLNHTIKEDQWGELKTVWKITSIIEPPDELKQLFLDVPFDNIQLISTAKRFVKFFKQNTDNKDTLVWVQGEPGLCFLLVDWLLQNNYTVIHATTPRISNENENIKISQFQHKFFRKYITLN